MQRMVNESLVQGAVYSRKINFIASFTENIDQTAGLKAGHTGHEWASELTCKMCCLKNMYIQPALHLIKNSRMFAWAGLFRFGYEI